MIRLTWSAGTCLLRVLGLAGTFLASFLHVSSAQAQCTPVLYELGGQSKAICNATFNCQALSRGRFVQVVQTNVTPPQLLSTVALDGVVNHMHTEFTGAVWAVDDKTLYGINSSNPSAAVRTGTLRLVTAPGATALTRVRIRGSYVYAIGGRILYIVDVSNPSAPVLRSATTFAGNTWLYDLDVVGSYAYLAMGDVGDTVQSLLVVSIANPNSPSEVRRVGIDATWRVAVPPGGAALYTLYGGSFGSTTSGLAQWNLSNPTNPTVQAVDTTDGAGEVDELVVTSAQMAHMINAYAQLGSVEMHNPGTLAPIGSSAPPYLPNEQGIAVDWPRLLVAERYGGMDLIDITNPSTPFATLRFYTAPPGYAEQIINNGSGYTAVTGGEDGAWFFDTTQAGQPRVFLNVLPLGGFGFISQMAGDNAYMVYLVDTNYNQPQYSTILAYQVTPGANPTAVLRGSYNTNATGGYVNSIDYGAVAGVPRLYYTTGYSGTGETLHILNVSNPAAITHDGQFALTTGVGDHIKFVPAGFSTPARVLAGSVYNGGQTQIVNVTIASAPSSQGVIPAPGDAIAVTGGTTVWLAHYDTARCYDITTPASPVARGSLKLCTLPDYVTSFRLTGFGTTASATTSNGNLVLVNTNADNPSISQIASVWSEAWALGYDASHGHIAAGAEGYKVINSSFNAPPVEDPGHVLASRTLCPSGPTTLHAAVVAVPAISAYRWYKGGSPLADGPTGTGSTISGSGTADLSITNSGAADAGAYFCRATNSCGTGDTSTANLTHCYANCDCSVLTPYLNVADFTCFFQKFATADPYANCDGSTGVPVLNVQDFTCFLQKFALGCP